MRVLYLSSEIFPFAKTGGLGDVAYSLPKALERLGVEVLPVMPLYPTVKLEGLKPVGEELPVKLAGRLYPFRLYRKEKYFFFHNAELFDRKYIYGPPGESYPDNDLRFGGFCWAVAKAIEKGLFKPDLIHANDWPTALYPVLHHEIYRFPQKVIFTIHNLAFQGLFEKDTIRRLHLPWSLYHIEALEYWGKINLMKGAIIFSDAVTTVSQTYAREILTYEYAYGLEGILYKYRHKLHGILNGIDYELWNPETDPHVYVPYSAESPSAKEENKQAMLKELGIADFFYEKPLMCFINRLSKQKGVEIILDSLENLSHLNAFFIFLGEGEYRPHFEGLHNRYPNIYAQIVFDEAWSHKVYAASDFILVPSLYEPCGITQLIAMRYGTLVVARKTGGLADTVVDVSYPEGYGLLFEAPDKIDFVCGVKRAVDLYQHRNYFLKLRQKVMKLDFSWQKSAKAYFQLYRKLLSRREKT
ncbi:glycogen synthase [Thermosulfurimonas dismutans]|uniref:Glycogen synthase n=1 Tax=Thermosulfurimonas dismutans TaxID=999894 RepID=A0A179D218_9BACT|nr:glycogen/starch synthase [Thermosulfurimonas dismutans]OAQ20115.1 Glycogen synthase, ADP-glucose transglucosylase [Thermosulfurimonas dismutans]